MSIPIENSRLNSVAGQIPLENRDGKLNDHVVIHINDIDKNSVLGKQIEQKVGMAYTKSVLVCSSVGLALVGFQFIAMWLDNKQCHYYLEEYSFSTEHRVADLACSQVINGLSGVITGLGAGFGLAVGLTWHSIYKR